MVDFLRNNLKKLFADWRLQESVIDDLQAAVAATIGIATFLTFLSVGCSGLKSSPQNATKPEPDRRAGADSTRDVERPPAPNLYREHEWHGRF